MSMKRAKRNLDPYIEEVLDRCHTEGIPLLYDQAVTSWDDSQPGWQAFQVILRQAQHKPLEGCVGRTLKIAEVAIIPIGEECSVKGSPILGYRTVLIDVDARSYYSDSPYIFYSLQEVVKVYGMPPWADGVNILVDHRGMVRERPMIVLEATRG